VCLCGNTKPFLECCEEIISYKRNALTPQELMRSRYSAYVLADANYLIFSAVKENRYKDDVKLIEEFSKSVQWLKLDVINAKGNSVEFKAYYKDNNSIQVLHEKSTFVKEESIWKYKDGKLYNSKIPKNESFY